MKVGSRSWLLGIALAAVAGCGGATSAPGGAASGAAGLSSTGGTTAGGAGVVGGNAGDHATGGTSSGGAGVGGVAGVGGKSAGGSSSGGSSNGGSSNGGSSNGGGSAGGDGGGAGRGGSAGWRDIEDCKVAYAGPSAGPRVGGPAPTSSCADISDQLMLARYMDFEGRVAEGLYYEPDGGLANEHWETPCSGSPAETAQRLALLSTGTAEAQFETPWFYEATACQDGRRYRYRNLRCDYFDGTLLTDKSLKNLTFLGSLLWWAKRYNQASSALLGYAASSGDATDSVELCSLDTSFGDFGLCDNISLMSTTLRMGQLDGVVQVGEPRLIKSVQGACH